MVVNKPADLVCHPTKTDAYSSLAARVQLAIGRRTPLHFVNRLDRETSGLVVIARDVATANRLRRIWGTSVRKEYIAILDGKIDASGRVEAPIGPYEKSLVYIKDQVREDGKPAITEYTRLLEFRREGRDYSLARLRLGTGRKHQIRIHMDWLGRPVVGDKLYGVDESTYLRFVRGELDDRERKALRLPHHALHAWRLCFRLDCQEFRFEIPPERWFLDFLPETFDIFSWRESRALGIAEGEQRNASGWD